MQFRKVKLGSDLKDNEDHSYLRFLHENIPRSYSSYKEIKSGK
jgi:hypothetical protein